MEHEGEAFGRRECVEDRSSAETDGVRQHGFLFGVGGVRPADGRAGQEAAKGLLAPRGACPQHVQADPGHDRREPPTEVLDPLASERLSRSQASCTASSDSLTEPNIR